MKLAYLLSLPIFVFAFSCETKPPYPRDVPYSDTIVTPAKTFIPSTGEIFTSKSYLFFGDDSLYIPITRYSVERYNSPGDTLALDQEQLESMGDTIQYRIQTKFGEQIVLLFKDQAKIWLDVNTLVKVTLYHGMVTHIKILGEAFIQPFINLTAGGVRDYFVHAAKGSSFNFRSVIGEPTTTVATANGSILVTYLGYLKTPKIKLKPGTEFYTSSEDTVCRKVDLKSIGSWKEAHSHVFKNADLTRITFALDKWYKTNTQLDVFLQHSKLSLEFSYRTPLDTLLALIKRKLPVTIKREEQNIEIARSN